MKLFAIYITNNATAMGLAGFNFGSFLSSVLRGVKPIEPVEMPTPPQPPIQIPSITTIL